MAEETSEQRPDILADILSDQSDGKIKGLDELNKLIYMVGGENVSVAKRPAGKISPKKKRRTPKKTKRKSTHYLTEEVFESLDKAKKTIKDFLPDGDKTRATKSRIVESAVKVLLDEFGRRGEDSYLVKEILNKKK